VESEAKLRGVWDCCRRYVAMTSCTLLTISRSALVVDREEGVKAKHLKMLVERLGHKDEWRQWRVQGVLAHMGVAAGEPRRLVTKGVPTKAPLTAEDSYEMVISCLQSYKPRTGLLQVIGCANPSSAHRLLSLFASL
jgi:hypothetical protein